MDARWKFPANIFLNKNLEGENVQFAVGLILSFLTILIAQPPSLLLTYGHSLFVVVGRGVAQLFVALSGDTRAGGRHRPLPLVERRGDHAGRLIVLAVAAAATDAADVHFAAVEGVANPASTATTAHQQLSQPDARKLTDERRTQRPEPRTPTTCSTAAPRRWKFAIARRRMMRMMRPGG
jgi:hypothetical protein